MVFVNREQELALLGEWWQRGGARMALVWGRRRVGKTALVEQFAKNKRVVFHTGAGRPLLDELDTISRGAIPAVGTQLRDLRSRPFADWPDVLETLAASAREEPLLLVLDEFPELLRASPELPGVLRASWDRIRSRSKLRILLSGSAVRTMEAMQEERAPLYGRFDLSLVLHPFQPHEAAKMLRGLAPGDRALVWGLVGGIPLYLDWWDQSRTVRQNLLSLACSPAGLLLTEGELVMATEGEAGDLGRQVLYAIAAGRTKHNEIADAIRADPTRTLERLVTLRLVDRMIPVTEDPRRTRRRLYRIADNFLAFWLGVLERHRAEIQRGLGRQIVDVVTTELDDYMGPRWEETFRVHLRRLAAEGELGEGIVAVGPFWTAADIALEIDAVVLAGRAREAVLVGEAKWAHQVDGERFRRELERKADALPRRAGELRYAVAARDEVKNRRNVLAVTTRDVF